MGQMAVHKLTHRQKIRTIGTKNNSDTKELRCTTQHESQFLEASLVRKRTGKVKDGILFSK